jgi:O-antigen/teichoic acid export membrane protein
LVLVPVTLNYLNPYEYGIWLTLNSILMWINTFDIGLGNGLRNKLAEALALNDKQKAKAYVSTTFFMLILIMLFLFIVFNIFSNIVDWYKILNVEKINVRNLYEIVIASFAFFCLTFIFKFIGNVYLALQLPAINNLLVLIGQVLSLIVIYLLTLFTKGSLLLVAIVYSAAPALIYMLSYPITFLFKYKFLAPSIRYFKFEHLRSLMSIGFKFLFLQLSGLVLFASSNIIITQYFGPKVVTPYNIAYQYFSVIPILFSILIAPMWSAATDAYTKGEMNWIKNSMHRIKRVLYYIAAAIVLMVIFSNIAYHLWIGKIIQIPISLSIIMGLYTYTIVWSQSYSSFLNGIGKLKLQSLNTVLAALFFFPLSLFLGKTLGIIGIALAMFTVNISGAILNTIQFNKIVSHKAYDIWNK